jgi:hypothetical protein
MVDLSLPGRTLPTHWVPIPLTNWLMGMIAMLITILLLAADWSAVMTDSARQCQRTGGLSSGFSSGFDVYRCKQP